MAAGLPASMDIAAVIPQDASSKVVSLTNFFAVSSVCFPLLGTGTSRQCWAESGHDGGFVMKRSAPLGYRPVVHILLYGGVLNCCLTEESVMLKAVCRWMV